jgi:hypothetical protein
MYTKSNGINKIVTYHTSKDALNNNIDENILCFNQIEMLNFQRCSRMI